MPQATTLRLVRGGPDCRRAAPGPAHILIEQHMMHITRVHSLAATLAADADVLVEALRYFTLPPRGARGR